MASLLAIDLPLGPGLEAAIRDCVERRIAFCVMDQRLAPRRRVEELERLGATALLDHTGRTALASGTPVDDEIGLVMLTSGSSGPPKAAQLSWSALQASAEITQSALRGPEPSAWLACLPACHIGGLAVILRAVLDDAHLIWDAAIDDAPMRGATHVALVRTQLARHDVSGYHTVLLGGAKPPGEVPDNVVATWGMTETGSGVVYDGVPLPGVEVVSVDGEICLRSPTLFRDYRDAPRPTRRGPDGRDDWFPTGDAGTVIDGRVSVKGRLDFVINSGGEKIWPEDLETLISSIAGVRDVGVAATPDDEWGERVVALVVNDGTNIDQEIRSTCEERIGPWAKPKEIRYVAAIPRTSNGKIRRRDLTYLH